MRILMTGCTPRHVASSRIKYDYLQYPPLLKGALEKLGHEVDHRAVRLDEKRLNQKYDLCLLGMIKPNAMSASRIIEGYWVMSQFSNDTICMYYDDWSCYAIKSGCQTTLNRWSKWINWKLGNDNPDRKIGGVVLTDKMEEQIYKQCSRLLTNPPRALCALWKWTDVEEFRQVVPPGPLFAWDPSPLVYRGKIDQVVRKRAWVHASLSDHEPWIAKQGFTWPIIGYGNRRLGQRIISESQVYTEYSKHYGGLAPKYPEGMQYWHRVRFLFASSAGTVMYMDPKQAFPNDSYKLIPDEVEAMDDEMLRDLAFRQKQFLMQNTNTHSQTIDQINAAINNTAKYCIGHGVEHVTPYNQ